MNLQDTKRTFLKSKLKKLQEYKAKEESWIQNCSFSGDAEAMSVYKKELDKINHQISQIEEQLNAL